MTKKRAQSLQSLTEAVATMQVQMSDLFDKVRALADKQEQQQQQPKRITITLDDKPQSELNVLY